VAQQAPAAATQRRVPGRRARAQVDKTARWGDLESDEEEEEEEDKDEEEEEAAGDEALADGLASVASGYSSLPSGIETPEVLDLRKAKAIGGGALCAPGRPM